MDAHDDDRDDDRDDEDDGDARRERRHRPDPGRMLVAAGLSTWGVMFAGQALAAATRAPLGTAPRAAALALWLAFPLAFWPGATSRTSAPARVALLAIQTAITLALTALGSGGPAGVLLAVVAGQLPLLLPAPRAAAWVCAQSAAFAGVLAARGSARGAVLTAAGYVGFQLFALGAAWLAQREARARLELARVNAELLGTQALLADGARAAERLRVARELHDAVGHHLTALALHLEVARNTTAGDAAVVAAQGIARAMLAEVREVVTALRVEQPVNLRGALAALAVGMPAPPRVHLAVTDDAAHAADAAAAHALFRCAQEALTNAARHAGASNVWIELAVRGDRALELRVRDDGARAGARPIAEGNGLRGLRERLREVGGELALEVPRGGGNVGGVCVTASVPLRLPSAPPAPVASRAVERGGAAS